MRLVLAGARWISGPLVERLLAIDLQASAPRSTRQAQVMRVASVLRWPRDNPFRDMELARASLDLFNEIGAAEGAWSLFLLARSVRALGDEARARTLYEESRALWQK